MAFLTRTITAAIACAPWKGRMILPAWPRSCDEGIRGFCLKPEPQILTQRNFRRRTPADALARISSHPERSEAKSSDPAAKPQSNATGFLDSARNDESFVAVRLPDLIIVDGGKGQLSSACRELQRLGLHDLPIIGLAKEHEEIYRPGRALPLRLPMDSPALRLLQRIRDEAHRFANAYHQLLMKKRVEESILDDCQGVSQNRKSLLLQQFGSVNRLRRASVDEIASTEGIGRKLAEEVHRFLQRH